MEDELFDGKPMTPEQKLNKKIFEMREKQIDEDKIEKYLMEQLRISNQGIKKHEMNNMIIRYSNFFRSLALKINFKELDTIKD